MEKSTVSHEKNLFRKGSPKGFPHLGHSALCYLPFTIRREPYISTAKKSAPVGSPTRASMR